jgi:uncharacterized membrane protein
VTSSRISVTLYTIAAFIGLFGLADATYLTVQYLTGETAVCGGSPDCFRVLGSVYARVGTIPLASIGALGYFAAFSMATFAAFGHARARTFFAVIVWAMFGVTLWLLYLQAFVLHAFCRYCLFSAALVFGLSAIAILAPSSRRSR